MRVAVILLLSLALAACGGDSDSDSTPASDGVTAAEKPIAEGYKTVMSHLAEGRYEEFCKGLTPASLAVTKRNSTCEEWAEQNGKAIAEPLKERLKGMRFVDATVDGDKATLAWRDAAGAGGTVQAQQVDGRWLYSAVNNAR